MQAPYTTASLYLDIISALYGSAVRAGRLPKTKVFSEIKAQLKALGPEGWKSGIDDEIFQRALRLTKNAHRLLSDDAIAGNLVLWSLTHSLEPLEQTAMMKKEDLDPIVGTHGSCVRVPSDLASPAPPVPQRFDTARSADTASADTAKPILNPPSASSAPHAPLRFDTASTSQDLRLKTEDSQLSSFIFNNLSVSNARRRYVFPLNQSQRTPAQLKKHVAKITNALFKRARLPQATDPNQTVEALWAYAALRVGVPASALVAHLGHAPLGLPILKLSAVSAQPSESMVGTHGSCVRASSDDRTPLNSSPFTLNSFEKNFASIGKIFLDNPPRWYAMSLRPGVRFTQLCRRIDLLTIKSEESRVKGQALSLKPDTLSLFYPCEEIARAIGKKIVIKQRPFIHSVVFFKAKLTDIGPLFAKIGDLAWCYRQSAVPGAPYAEISENQFRLFQQTIAQFTPDYEVASTGELELKKNDRVQIVGGLFAGHEATFVKSEESRVKSQVKSEESRVKREVKSQGSRVKGEGKSEEGNIIYRLNIVGDNGIEWRVNVDKRLAKPSVESVPRPT